MGSDAPVDETDARDFWAIYEARYAAVNSATLEAAREDPSFAPIVEAMAPEVIDAQRQEGHEDLRRAMAGDWASYADKLKSQGVTYAALGVEMAAWQRLVRVAERALTPELVGAFIDEPPRLTRALCAMQDFFAWVIGVIAESYLESKQAALKASELRFRRLSESGMIGVMVADLEGGFHEANDAFLDMIGHTREELEDGRVRWTEMTPPEWEEADRVAIEQLTERGFADPFEKEYIRADGARVPVLLCVAMLEPPYVVCLALDRTREYELERFQERADELQQENRRIQEASRLKSEFLANMSHELRTPLNAIIGFAELLHDGQVPHDAPEHQEFLGDILTSGRHLLQLINDVLDLSKVEAGKLDFHPEEIDLEKVVGEVVSILRTSAATGRIDLSVEVDPAADTAYLDPSRLKQVLYNYVSNALKFTDEGGAVVIRVLPEAEGVLRVEVEDDGVGIAPEDAGKLFVAFQQLDGGAGKSHAGTGLGLALTRRLVEAQGGTVGVDSEPGRGSRFYAVLPRRCENGTALPSPRRFEAPPGAPRVLVVEDDARDQTLIATSLTQAGYAVETVSTGAQALARCREVAFDAVTLDLTSPITRASTCSSRSGARAPTATCRSSSSRSSPSGGSSPASRCMTSCPSRSTRTGWSARSGARGCAPKARTSSSSTTTRTRASR